MTEDEWLRRKSDWDQFYSMCKWLVTQRKARRKLRLWGSACVRRTGELLKDRRSHDALQTSEQYADGLVDRAALRAAKRPAWIATNELGELIQQPGQGPCWAARAAALTLDIFIENVSTTAAISAAIAFKLADVRTRDVEQTAQIRLLRDIFGNPFRPVSFDPAWRTDTALSLARVMYESREFSAMPILADVLQDAGCEDADVLTHCRDPKGTHARGCWVVDLVLGKS